MSEESSHIVTRSVPPGDAAADDVSDQTTAQDPELIWAERALVDREMTRFAAAVDRQLDDRLGDAEIELRRQRVRRRIDRWADESFAYGSVNDLAANGYLFVRLWLRLIAANQLDIGLATHDLDEIAQETVAQAVNRVCDEPALHTDWKIAFLMQCVQRLPHAYLSWRLRVGMLDSEEFHEVRSEAAGDQLVDRLRRCVAGPRAAELMREWGYRDGIDEALELTRAALSDPQTDRTGRDVPK